MNATVTQETLHLFRQALSKAMTDPELAKVFAQATSPTSGITAYDLEGPAKKLYPVLTPLRNRIPRTSGKGGIQANWRAVTGINTSRVGIGLSEGNRGQNMQITTADYIAVYRTIGMDNYATYQADWAARGFDDVKAMAVQQLLESLMIGEEQLILGGNNSVAFGTTPTPTLTGSASGGSLATQTLSVICVALTMDGYLSSSLAAGLPLSPPRTLADGTLESFNYPQGTAKKSANQTVAITGPSGSCQASVAAVAGAVAYAWFWGTAGNETLGAITTINSVLIAATATGTQLVTAGFSTDYSANSYVFDGLLAQVNKAGMGGYVATQATGTPGTGTPLTANGDGTIAEMETDLKYFWDNYRLSPTDIYVSSQEQMNIGKKILAGTADAAQRFVFAVEQNGIIGGWAAKGYLNRYSLGGAQEIPIHLHPNLTPGTILYFTEKLPYPLSNVTNVLQIRARMDYFQVDWPITSLKYPYGVYADEVLQNYFIPAFGIRTNIANG